MLRDTLELKQKIFTSVLFFKNNGIENACSGEVNLNEWKEVWQYGTNEANTPLWLQDGVAPQCAVGNIGVRRAFIPAGVKQGFVDSHMIVNYDWIFTREKGVERYVTPRK